MTAPRLLHHLPAHIINGLCVALGIGLVHLLAGQLGGATAGLAATSGAVYASLADLPNPPHRNWRRVLTAAVIGCLAGLLLSVLRSHPVALGVAIGLLGAASAMTLAWGVRAGPISFVAVLAYVFTMALPPPASLHDELVRLGWTALGAGLYLGWAVLTSVVLQRRLRTLALAAAFEATAQRLRSRAAVLASAATPVDASARVRNWIAEDARVDERVQAARDLLFAAPDTPAAARQTALLVLLIDLRDALLMGELDVDLMGHDAPGLRLRGGLAAALRRVADELHTIRDALALGRPLPASAGTEGVAALLAPRSALPEGDPRRRLVPVVRLRVQHVTDDVAQMQALMRGGQPHSPVAPDELQLFVSAEGWPLAALRPHLRWRSPVLRHAIRTGLALAGAYLIGALLPWASHPHWLVLSVAVVLRGNLEQTLSRRNGRVIGTALGCLLVLALAQVQRTGLSAAVFLVAAGTAHAFVTRRYVITAIAATVMALLQAQLAAPLNDAAVVERLADTVLGAGLAWAFSYVLPSWERHGLARLAGRLTRALTALSAQALRMPRPGDAELALRMARREVYDALGGLAAAAQRTRVEPERVRLPVAAFAALLSHSHALLAHLAAIRMTLTRNPQAFDPAATEATLTAAHEQFTRCLQPAPGSAGDCAPASDGAAPEVPAQSPEDSLLPWLQRRLRMAAREATRVAHAAAALRATADPPRRAPE